MNAAHGFINMLSRLVKDRDPDLLVCCTDVDWRPEWRVELIASYKTHRVGQPLPELDVQIPVVYELLQTAGVAVVGSPNYEAEDIIGALVPRCPGRVEIVSGDRDLFQLVRDPDVSVLYPRRGVSELWRVDEVEIAKKFQIPGTAYGDFALLRGDSSDGLPGVPGIGEKTAALLVSRYGSLAGVIEAALTGDGAGVLGKVRSSLDYLDRAARVVFISDEAPVGELDMSRPRFVSPETIDKAVRWGLANAFERLDASLRSGRATTP
jgi:5'-3' exonuclease